MKSIFWTYFVENHFLVNSFFFSFLFAFHYSFGRKTIIISGVVLQGISCLTLSQMQNIYAILSLRFLAAVADSGVVIPSAVFGTPLSSFRILIHCYTRKITIQITTSNTKEEN